MGATSEHRRKHPKSEATVRAVIANEGHICTRQTIKTIDNYGLRTNEYQTISVIVLVVHRTVTKGSPQNISTY